LKEIEISRDVLREWGPFKRNRAIHERFPWPHEEQRQSEREMLDKFVASELGFRVIRASLSIPNHFRMDCDRWVCEVDRLPLDSDRDS